ncbi:MAG: hypothetical protein JWP74_2695 [Marmoricola sp.]|nr:hypothetical protein [Marmoricola sp.]
MGLLEGETIVVTGSGRGLGRAYVLACAREGASVVVNDVDGEEAQTVADEARSLGAAVLVSTADVGDREQVEAMMDAAVRSFGSIDGLVNNAAVYDIVDVGQIPAGVPERALRVNVLGPVLCTEAAVPHLRRRGGSIVNITSGAQCGMPRLSVYGATKGAVASLTYAWATELEPDGIRVNAISPTAGTRMVTASVAQGLAGIDAATPPEDIAPVVVYLLSDRSAAVTGQVLRFDRGALSVMAHPHVREPMIRCDTWTVDDVAHAVDELRPAFMGAGVVVA